jgi:hypothetical protein
MLNTTPAVSHLLELLANDRSCTGVQKKFCAMSCGYKIRKKLRRDRHQPQPGVISSSRLSLERQNFGKCHAQLVLVFSLQ